jgi:hypothetical protein
VESDQAESWDQQAVLAFSERLELFATSLSDQERRVLIKMILAAMDPLDRIKHLDTHGLISVDEETLIQSLEAQH